MTSKHQNLWDFSNKKGSTTMGNYGITLGDCNVQLMFYPLMIYHSNGRLWPIAIDDL